MSRVGRLAGAILAETGSRYFLVGNLKRPCDFPAAGFEPPAEPPDALVRPYLLLARSGPLAVPGPWLTLPLEGEALPHLLAERLLIARTGAVSDRLWRLILSEDPDHEPDPAATFEVGWLATLPAHLWQIVRDTVLRCT